MTERTPIRGVGFSDHGNAREETVSSAGEARAQLKAGRVCPPSFRGSDTFEGWGDSWGMARWMFS